MLEKRLDKMEKILYPGGKDEKVALSPTSSTSDDRRTTMTTSTASDSVRPEFAASSAPSHPTASPIKMEASPIPNDQQVLPPGDVIEHLVTLFFDNVYTTIPVLDPRTFMQDVRQGKCSEFLLLSVMSVAARFSSRPDIKETPAWHAGEKYAKKARDLHVVKAIDDPSLANVQALLLLTLHEFGCARGPR
ncbi:uncharacterized protein BYT42DRAFT_385263 [Radiomyces spectabilis]|uniref:uncharacterized protein n=1 Tax=Radiomyces spectabilis TaxID=64574 RepID=UPI00221E5B35|nr:uncharacterized protein BYT42DRAFT_385263 [Radiomyces spectabilis]KAI8376394.1 hypothetical protein BYT42DRAFT_385263 [Radiomyces spectabilis]